MADPIRIVEVSMRVAFACIALVLALFAVTMTVYGIGQSVHALIYWQNFGNMVLRGVGYIVISIAVFEVAKYLIEEEVLRGREMRSPTEARRSLTKFISTISIAVFLEGLVTVFRVSHENVTELIYPALVLLVAISLILGLGLFQRLSASVESQLADERRKTAE